MFQGYYRRKKKLNEIKKLGFNNYVKYSGAGKNRADSGSYSVFRKNYFDIENVLKFIELNYYLFWKPLIF